MKYIKTYDNFKPIKNNLEKPFKIKKNIDTSIRYLRKGVKSLRRRLDDQKMGTKDKENRSKMNKNKNSKIQKLKELTYKQLKQNEYIRTHPVKENVENSEKDLISILSSPDFKPEDIVNYIGLEEKEYEIDFNTEYNYETHRYESNYDKDGVKILLKTITLEDLMDIEHSVIAYFLQFTGYNDYEFYVDDDELNYLGHYLPDELIEKIKKLSILFNTGIDIEENKYNQIEAIPKLFEYLGLKDKLDDFKSEIAMENERAIEKSAIAEIKKLPFELDYKYGGDFDIELYFDYEKLIEYIKKNDIKAKTIKDVLENIYNADEFTFENEYERASEFMGDFKDLIRSVENVVDEYLDSPEEIFPKAIAIDNLELLQNNMELADFENIYEVYIKYNRKMKNLFQIAKEYNGEILKWFSSDKFEELINNRSEKEIANYRDFIFKEDTEKYNL